MPPARRFSAFPLATTMYRRARHRAVRNAYKRSYERRYERYGLPRPHTLAPHGAPLSPPPAHGLSGTVRTQRLTL